MGQGSSAPSNRDGRGRAAVRVLLAGVDREDHQDPVTSRQWQPDRAVPTIDGSGRITAEFSDVGLTRSLSWVASPLPARTTFLLRSRTGRQVVAQPSRGRAWTEQACAISFPLRIRPELTRKSILGLAWNQSGKPVLVQAGEAIVGDAARGGGVAGGAGRSGPGFDAVVIGSYGRAFFGNQFSLVAPLFAAAGAQLWLPEVGGPLDPEVDELDELMALLGILAKREVIRGGPATP